MELTKNISQTTIIKSLFAIILGSIALTISAKIKIPFYPVPMTMQTFVVLFLGVSLGYKIGLASVSLYLLEGILGLPVFSNSPEKGVGFLYFTGPTMGYLIGFLTASFLASKINNMTIKTQPYDTDKIPIIQNLITKNIDIESIRNAFSAEEIPLDFAD